ncbi:MAG: hypothetical protein IJ584_02685 [Bacteroidales bacterium]|nr:hypothetical protein [Bacteroidales bacterium]
MQCPIISKAFRRAISSTNTQGREWLTRMTGDDYVRDILDFEQEPGSNFATLWVVTDPGAIHAYSVPVKKGCEPSYLGTIEQYFRNHTRTRIRGHQVGYWSWQFAWHHRMRCWLRRHGLAVDFNYRITQAA